MMILDRLVPFGNGRQVVVNLVLSKYGEGWLILGHDGNLNLCRLKVGRQDGGQTVDSGLQIISYIEC